VNLRAIVPLVTVAAGVVAWSVRSSAQPPAELLHQPVQSGPRIQGVGGCAAAACHNAPLAVGRPGTEYATWVADPHGRAAGNRQAPAYQAVLARLKGSVYTEELCLKCHATPTSDGTALAKDLIDDGIGCEACHGAAEKWRTEHYKDSWKQLDPVRKEAEYGFFPTKDLGRRIEKCAECHVGNADKDVNHDLIAAGHPRLSFEYAAYHHLITPRHWQEPHERDGVPSDWEARAWVTGQAAVAKATAELTAARAKVAGGASHPWPEFTEYGCFACHHDLKPKQNDNPGSTWRQHPRYAGLKPGSLPWGTWVRPGAETLSKLAPGWGPPGGDPFTELSTALGESSPDPKAAQTKAEQTAAKLKAWLDGVKPPTGTVLPPDAPAVRKLLAALIADGISRADWPREWDDAAQHYLALAALYQSLIDLDPAAATPARREMFAALRKVLRFPPDGDKSRNSPADFTPAQYKQALQPFATEFRTPDAP
jgi:hypothetical protein